MPFPSTVNSPREEWCPVSPIRHRGLQWPPNIHQIIAVVIFFILFSSFILTVFNGAETNPFVLLLSTCYACCCLLMVFCFLHTSWIDPVEREDNSTNAEVNYCVMCQLSPSAGSKHCHVCNKCVRGFDHHCLWLNTCIGVRNYRPFLSLLVSSLLFLLIQIATGLFLLVRSYMRSSWNEKETIRLGNSMERVLIVSQLVISLFCFYGLGVLFFLHLVLIWRNMTTYEFISMQKELVQLWDLRDMINNKTKNIERKWFLWRRWNRNTSKVQPNDMNCHDASFPPFDEPQELTRRKRAYRDHIPAFYPILAWRIQHLLEKERSGIFHQTEDT